MFRFRLICLMLAGLIFLGGASALHAQGALSGRVTLSDGNPPPEPAEIVTNCLGRRQVLGETKPDGTFRVSLAGQPTSSMSDARAAGLPKVTGGVGTSDGPFMGTIDLTQCDLTAALPGYSSTTIRLGRRSMFEASEIGMLVLTPYGEHGDTSVSVTTLKAPDKAKKAFEDGMSEARRDKPNWGKATKHLSKAVELYPDFAEAWYELGEARLRLGKIDSGKEALLGAIAIDGNFHKPLAPLALIELKQGNKQEAAGYADQAVALNPGFTEAQFYCAMAHFMLGELPRAAEAAAMVERQGAVEAYPRVLVILGDAATQKNDAKEAVRYYSRYLELEPDTQMAAQIKQRLAEWKSMGVLD